MRPRKRIKDLYDQLNHPDDKESDQKSFKIGNIDLSKAIQAKMNQIRQQEMDNNNNDNGNI